MIPAQLFEFTEKILIAYGGDPQEAKSLAEILVWCDSVGRPNQGVWRLPLLTKRLSQGLLKSPCNPKLDHKKPGLALMDGDAGFGHHIARLAMDEAITLTKHTGIGCVGVYNSNFFGAGAYYVQQAAAQQMIGIATSNSFPKVAAFGGVKSVLGTNPFAFGAPRGNGQSILLDMATSASAGSTITKSAEQKQSLPAGVAIDKQGQAITDPNLINSGSLLPFGGAKGFGLAIMVEILSGIITGAGFSHSVYSMYKDFERSGNNGHLFIAIDVAALIQIEVYYDRIESLISILKASTNDLEGFDVLYPGESRWSAAKNIQEQGIQLDQETRDALAELAQPHSISLPWI